MMTQVGGHHRMPFEFVCRQLKRAQTRFTVGPITHNLIQREILQMTLEQIMRAPEVHRAASKAASTLVMGQHAH